MYLGAHTLDDGSELNVGSLELANLLMERLDSHQLLFASLLLADGGQRSVTQSRDGYWLGAV